MPDVKPGDAVTLVWACCAKGRKHIGWVGPIEAAHEFEPGYQGSPCFCGYKTYGTHALVDIGGKGWVPFSWLRPYLPPEEAADDTERLLESGHL